MNTLAYMILFFLPAHLAITGTLGLFFASIEVAFSPNTGPNTGRREVAHGPGSGSAGAAFLFIIYSILLGIIGCYTGAFALFFILVGTAVVSHILLSILLHYRKSSLGETFCFSSFLDSLRRW